MVHDPRDQDLVYYKGVAISEITSMKLSDGYCGKMKPALKRKKTFGAYQQQQMERYTHIWEKSQKIRAHSENVVAKQRKVPSKKAGKKQSKLTSFLAPTPQVQLAAEEDQPQEQHHQASFGANQAGGLLEELAAHIDPLLLWDNPQ